MLTIQFVRYGDIEPLASDERIKKLLDIVRKDNIVILEGRLHKEEEAELIKTTMKSINKFFKGIELGVIYPDEQQELDVLRKMKKNVLNLLLGNRRGLTIIGPATIIKEIKHDPQKIQLLTTINARTSKKTVHLKKWKPKKKKKAKQRRK